MKTSPMTSQGGLKVGPLYSFINEIATFFMITKKRAKISSLNLLCIGIMRLSLHLYICVFMTWLMTWPGHEVGQIFKLIHLRQYLSYSVDQKLKISEIFMAILLVYSTSGIKKFVATWNWRPFWKFWNIILSCNLTSDMKKLPKLYQKYFSWWWRHRWRHRVASKFPSIFMFSRDWLREQVARSRQ